MAKDTEKLALEQQEAQKAEEERLAKEAAEKLAEEQDAKPFTPEQEQYMGSWMGRNIKKHVEEGFAAIREQVAGEKVEQPPIPEQPGVIEKFNEEISTQMFTDPYGAYKRMREVYDGTQTTLGKNQKTQVDKTLMTYSEKPHYKEIFGNMQKIAHKAVAEGYPPEAATEYAYQKARADHLDTKSDMEDLDLLEGGLPRKNVKKAKLPPQYKAAFIRDKEAGLFKTEQEFIDSLAPVIRAQLGL